jgi:Na+-driven multidrug efflux pump
MGVLGAAVATVASQALSGLLCLFYMYKKFPIVHMTKEERAFNHQNNVILLNMGIPSGLVNSITSIGSIMLQTAVNGIDVASVQAYAASMKIKFFFISPYDAIGNATATYAGQNLGAGKVDRIKKGVRAGIYMGLIYSLFACIILHLFGGNIALLFMDKPNTIVLDKVNQFMRITSLFYIVISFLNVHRSAIQGMGYSKLAMYSGIFEMIARCAMSICIIPRVGFTAVCYTDQTAWIAATVFVTIAFYVVLKKKRAIIYQCSGSHDMQDK